MAEDTIGKRTLKRMGMKEASAESLKEEFYQYTVSDMFGKTVRTLIRERAKSDNSLYQRIKKWRKERRER